MLNGVSQTSDYSQLASSLKSQSDSTSSSTSEATITANDFLTLLVSELKNQDPTSASDPNEYVNQLVEVNSLEQLISINENTTKSTTTSSGGEALQSPNVQQTSPIVSATESASSGNLSIPAATNQASRVATALTRTSSVARQE